MNWSCSAGPGADLKIRQRLAVPAFPVSVALARDGRAGTVASLWSRRLAFLEFDDQGVAKVVDVLDLPFAPRCQLYAKQDKRLIVAETERQPRCGHRGFPGHTAAAAIDRHRAGPTGSRSDRPRQTTIHFAGMYDLPCATVLHNT
ncbi:MAG: hypothetical protein QGH33_09050 [Pirellulaceae bacterium]|jgi:hypothetical protein|nr:hypothetical protein [Pirellulaceae bacterium]MDP7303188.1 hypothetical protein [Pirellulaceae bacterium]HJN08282.1 hypothetical protein [Pirellulaceae bacterium]